MDNKEELVFFNYFLLPLTSSPVTVKSLLHLVTGVLLRLRKETNKKMTLTLSIVPWPIRAAAPPLVILSCAYYLHQIFLYNQLELIGVTFSLTVGSILIFNVLKFVYRNWLGILLGHNVDLLSLGQWAVITGSTDGIGKAYTHALAKRGINVVLISRSADKLNQVASEIREMHQVETKVITADFTGGLEIYDNIEKQLEGLDIGILINNVGMCYAFPEYFMDLPGGRKYHQDMFNCNMTSVTMMTSIVLPKMTEKKKGAIVNVSSISSKIYTPYLTLYGATKAFVDKFTQDLMLEYRDQGILFQSLVPGYIVSNMSKVKKSTFFVPTPDDFVDKALALIGLETTTAVWIPHQLIYLCINVGIFFRREGGADVAEQVGRQFWLYGKKVMMYRKKILENEKRA